MDYKAKKPIVRLVSFTELPIETIYYIWTLAKTKQDIPSVKEIHIKNKNGLKI